MAKFNWTEITREEVISAIHKFKKYKPECPKPRSTFVLYEGEKLPAKHIRGMAYMEHYGVEISKNDFGGGMETVKFFQRLGFQTAHNGVIYDSVSKKKISKKAEPVMNLEETKKSGAKKKV